MVDNYKLVEFFNILDLPKKEIIEKCISMRLIPGHRTCSQCGKSMSLKPHKTIDGVIWRCHSTKEESRHNEEVSIRKDTWFQRSTLKMDKILLITAMWVVKLQPQLIRQEAGVNRKSVRDWINLCREVCYLDYLDNPPKLGGEGKIVQIDIREFGPEEWVFGGVDVDTDDIFIEALKNRDDSTLTDIIEKYVLPGSTIYPDGWKASSKLGEAGCRYLKVNHKLQFRDPGTGGHANKIKALWATTKGSYSKSKKLKGCLPYFLAESRWRRLNRMGFVRNKLNQAILVQLFFEAIIKRYPG